MLSDIILLKFDQSYENRKCKNLLQYYLVTQMNNANCYAFESKTKYVFDSDQEEEYEFRGSNIVRTQKSMSMISSKQHKQQKQIKQMKKSNSFLLVSKPKVQSNKTIDESKDKSKTSKKCLNISQARKKPAINSKNSMNKTSVSINSLSIKSTKALKKRSGSRDYLMLDQEIYECQNIQEINQKLVCGGSQVYSHQRFIKATLKNQEKLQNYISSFAQYIRFSRKNHINVNQMTEQQKKKLYMLLKSEKIQGSTKDGIRIKQNKKLLENSFTMQNLIKQAVHKIQKKTKEVLNQRPQQQNEIKKWKNKKLHELMAFHTCLNEQNRSSDRIFQNLISEQSQQQKCFKEQISQRSQKELKIEINEINKKIEGVEVFINKNHIIQQKYPQTFKNNLIVEQQIHKYLPDEHMLSDLGIENYLHCFWDYLVDHELIGELTYNLREPYAISHEDKISLLGSGTQNQCQWTAFLMLSIKKVLRDQIFIDFCKSTNDQMNELGQQERKAVILFRKSIFDCLNIQLSKFQTDYPLGPFHPLESNSNNSTYMIDQENAMQVWDECIQKILQNNRIGMGLLLNPSNEQVQIAKNKHYQQSFKVSAQKQAQQQMWQRIKPLTLRRNFQEIMKKIQQDLYQQLNDELKKF